MTQSHDPLMLAKAETLVEAVHLTAEKDRLVGELAYGQQRQLEIALALSGAPRFVLFDEPAAGLSPNSCARRSASVATAACASRS